MIKYFLWTILVSIVAQLMLVGLFYCYENLSGNYRLFHPPKAKLETAVKSDILIWIPSDIL